MFMDSLSLFDVIAKASTTVEKRLMIDLETVKNAHQQAELGQIGFIRSQQNIPDCLTKGNGNEYLISTEKTATPNQIGSLTDIRLISLYSSVTE